ncbi:unnamed protein product [Clonostachys solani]|uniref:Uncharacterized protein n=1 Tax=Clonostachys solani TaxID=160281 RepID=A0A9P0ECU2_9HYPO|nr:unnamed protein product [Clonostachys solani]
MPVDKYRSRITNVLTTRYVVMSNNSKDGAEIQEVSTTSDFRAVHVRPFRADGNVTMIFTKRRLGCEVWQGGSGNKPIRVPDNVFQR